MNDYLLLQENFQKKKPKKYILKSYCFYGCLLACLILYIFDLYFEKLCINKAIIKLWDSKKLDKSTNKKFYKQNETQEICEPFNKITNSFNISIDGEIFPKFTPMFNNPKINYTCLNKNKSSKIILFWNNWFGDSTYDYGIGYETPFEKNRCPVTNCELVNDHKRLNESDLIVFHMRDPINQLPEYRRENQRWIFYLYESPVHSQSYEEYNNLFNLSATYMLNSDFTSLYFLNYIWIENSNFNINRNFAETKTEFAAIIVSNCNAKNGRLEYVEALQKSIPVTIFGKCGKPCPNSYDNGTQSDCKEIISQKYKFYLAFENSICKNYLTEKFFDILRFDIVPVVYGDGAYETYIPKSGYINAFDFVSAKHLADYLIYLDRNNTAYNSYFKWKKYIKFIDDGPRNGQICEMCIRLNLDSHLGVKKSIITDMKKFWSVENNCKNTNDVIFS